MINIGQIRRFKDSNLPTIKINHYNENSGLWFCVFQEDFKFPYISLSESQIEIETELINC